MTCNHCGKTLAKLRPVCIGKLRFCSWPCAKALRGDAVDKKAERT